MCRARCFILQKKANRILNLEITKKYVFNLICFMNLNLNVKVKKPALSEKINFPLTSENSWNYKGRKKIQKKVSKEDSLALGWTGKGEDRVLTIMLRESYEGEKNSCLRLHEDECLVRGLFGERQHSMMVGTMFFCLQFWDETVSKHKSRLRGKRFWEWGGVFELFGLVFNVTHRNRSQTSSNVWILY